MLVSATIVRVRIHERQLVHVVKHMGSIEPNVQKLVPLPRHPSHFTVFISSQIAFRNIYPVLVNSYRSCLSIAILWYHISQILTFSLFENHISLLISNYTPTSLPSHFSKNSTLNHFLCYNKVLVRFKPPFSLLWALFHVLILPLASLALSL